ncbi:MAG TPA: type II/IV secretion system protein [Longimicrobiaceae bacterium]|jgi:type II secretory ATPase GspE/PulE/Tfp pilus assembly ATPase PilB-like protein/CheY-like chemotaxis protein
MTTRNPKTGPSATRSAAWPDQWLMDEFRRIGHGSAAAAAAMPAPTAWEALSAAGVADSVILKAASAASRLPAADLSRAGAELAPLLPRAAALRFDVAPVRLHEGALEVAAANPVRHGLAEELQAAASRPVRLVLASPAQLRTARESVYRAPAPPPPAAAHRRPPATAPAATPAAAPAPLDLGGAPVEVLDRILAAALRDKASDVHLEPKADGMLARFRVDGALYDAGWIPAETALPLVSRIKVTANLDIADRIRPQDGRAVTRLDGRPVDLRVSTLPLGGLGEKVVIRILDSAVASTGLASLGFTPAELHRLDRLLAMREGMILATGPTGSGKTTTLYSALRHVQSSESNVVTVEDPIEYRLPGINQVQVNDRAGLDFAAALRSILRQDPDIVLVGEIRDAETAQIAIKASMTGHVVLSTLHTNDAPSAISRLADIGAEAGALSGALKGVLAQRLVRRLCGECSQPLALSDLPPEQQVLLMGRRTDGLRRHVGCAACRGTGYRGRMVVAEILVVDAAMQHAIARGAGVPELTELARGNGMRTLWESGLERVLAGATSLHELVDNVAAPAQQESAAQSDVDALLAQLLGGGGKAPAAASAPAAPAARPPSVPARAGGGPGARVLVVDEDREARRALRAELEGAGFRVIEAADGEAGVAYARRLRPDLVVTEIAMPRLDGIGLLQALRDEAGSPPVVVRTGQDDAALLEWALELGAQGVYDRSADARLLTACVQAPLRSAA